MGKRIGIFGGSFNPIHTGHAIIANYVSQRAGLDQLWIMVSPQNPLKQEFSGDYDLHRLKMAELVSRRLDNVVTSGFEFGLPRPSYTIDTLNELQHRFPDDEFWLVIGADNWCVFDKWKSHDEIVARHHILIYPRRGYDVEIPKELSARVKVVDAPLVEVSSTEIRAGLKQMRNMAYYMPDDVYRYVIENRLYM